MTKWQRLEKVIEGATPDRTPVSLWRHFLQEEQTAKGLAGAMLDFQRKFDWDFMKVNPRACYHAEPWGNTYEFGNDHRTKPKLERCVVDERGWQAIGRIPPDQGAFGEHLQALEMIGAELNNEVPFIMTIFSPPSIGARIAGSNERFRELMRTDPETTHQVLREVTRTFIDFIDACMQTGAWGFFYATTYWANPDNITREEYDEFSRPYDLQLLEAMEKARFNLLHVCESNNYLADLLDYPHVHLINWDWLDQTNLAPREVLNKIELPVAGGISKEASEAATTAPIIAEVAEARSLVPPNRLILTGACTVSVDSRDENLMAVRKAVEA